MINRLLKTNSADSGLPLIRDSRDPAAVRAAPVRAVVTEAIAGTRAALVAQTLRVVEQLRVAHSVQGAGANANGQTS